MNKVVFVLAAVLALAFSEEHDHGKLNKIHEECQADPATKIDMAVGDPSVSPNFGAHTLCMHVKGGLMNENGDVNVENMRKVLSTLSHNDAAEVDQIVNECGTRVGSTAVEAAIALHNCFRKHRNEHDREHDHGHNNHH
ncbi:hypothetical protein JTB14_032804 [Gonioctena quinquepunctata]|nr:hypothetical protein JTB14_032804 [Gonioctena quinquepunctata]